LVVMFVAPLLFSIAFDFFSSRNKNHKSQT
jgi:hypothetical protein